ncbi:MAG: OmpA family protein [Cyclobacteriaceae bacterium]|nr:OmpA family protein [Cyclobacteriaceae bacterium]
MRNLVLIFGFIAIFCVVNFSIAFAQIRTDRILRNTQRNTERKVEQRVERRLDQAVDKTLDEIEAGLDAENNEAESAELPPQRSEATDQEVLPELRLPEDELKWMSFDFIPGDIILFEDDLSSEKNGEFPGKWDLVAGTVENAQFGDDNVIYFRQATSRQGIVPLIRENPKDYLPDAFTLEFDAYFEAGVFNQTYYVNFYDMKNQRRILNDLRVYINKAVYDRSEGNYPNVRRSHIDEEAKWRRVSISFNQRALKVYLDETRLLNIPNLAEKPTGITIRGNNPQADRKSFIKNIRIAKGAVPLYDKFLTDGKIIAHGIRFDVNKATLRPESMGIINEIVDLMKQKPELKFSVEGHTDSDGNAESNQRLSEARAQTVKNKMIEMGISKDRLKADGHGAGKPIAPNQSAEDKAMNRRVEFVKM